MVSCSCTKKWIKIERQLSLNYFLVGREYSTEQNRDEHQAKRCNTEAEIDRAWTRLNTDAVWGRYTWSRGNSWPGWGLETSIILIKINFCHAAKLSSFTFVITLLASSTHRVEQVVFEKVRKLELPWGLKLCTNSWRDCGLTSGILKSSEALYSNSQSGLSIKLRQVQKVLPNVLLNGEEKKPRKGWIQSIHKPSMLSWVRHKCVCRWTRINNVALNLASTLENSRLLRARFLAVY